MSRDDDYHLRSKPNDPPLPLGDASGGEREGPRRPRETIVKSFRTRKAIIYGVVVPGLLIPFTLMLLHHKGFIDVEDFGIPENYVLWGWMPIFAVVFLIGLIVWRCPACKSYLGRNGKLPACPHCGEPFTLDAREPWKP